MCYNMKRTIKEEMQNVAELHYGHGRYTFLLLTKKKLTHDLWGNKNFAVRLPRTIRLYYYYVLGAAKIIFA